MQGTATDCNSNATIDICEIAGGAVDINQDGVPDECQCIADINSDGIVGAADLAIVLGFWGPISVFAPADLNGDDQVDAADLTILLSSWGSCL